MQIFRPKMFCEAEGKQVRFRTEVVRQPNLLAETTLTICDSCDAYLEASTEQKDASYFTESELSQPGQE